MGRVQKEASTGTAVAQGYQGPFKFTGKIDKVTVDIKPTNPADKAEIERTHAEGALKKGLSD